MKMTGIFRVIKTKKSNNVCVKKSYTKLRKFECINSFKEENIEPIVIGSINVLISGYYE